MMHLLFVGLDDALSKKDHRVAKKEKFIAAETPIMKRFSNGIEFAGSGSGSSS